MRINVIKNKRLLQNYLQTLFDCTGVTICGSSNRLFNSVKASLSATVKGLWITALPITISTLSGCCCHPSNSSPCCSNRPLPVTKTCSFKPVCNPREHAYGIPYPGSHLEEGQEFCETQYVENVENVEETVE